MSLTETFDAFADGFRHRVREQFEFKKVEWFFPVFTGTGTSGPTAFLVNLRLDQRLGSVQLDCSICGKGQCCPHAMAFVVLLSDSGIAEEVEFNELEPSSYTLKKKPVNPWKSQLGNLVQQLRYHTPTEPVPVRFPIGREARNTFGPGRQAGQLGKAFSKQRVLAA